MPLHLLWMLGVSVLALLFFTPDWGGSAGAQPDYIQRLSYLEDASASLTADDAVAKVQSFQATDERSLNFGLTESAYWVWITIPPESALKQSLRLELGYPHLDHLEVFRIADGSASSLYLLGDAVAFNSRPVKDRTFILPITGELLSQSEGLLLRVQSKGSMQLPIKVKTLDQYHMQDRDEQLMLGFYYGILLGVFAYNLLLAVGTREPVYGYYCAYAVFLTLFQFSQNGLAFEYLWQSQTNWHQISIPIFASLALLFCTRFTQCFLNITRHNLPKLAMTYQVLTGIFAALAVASFVADRSLIITLVSVVVSLSGVFMIATAYYLYLKGDDNAFYYLLAWTILLFGVVIYSTKTLGLVPENFITEYSVQIGSAIEMILLSYALADRFNRLRDENIQVHAEAKAMLESRVEQRTQELQQAMLQFEAANDQLASLSQRDPMTGLFNRRYFNEVLEQLRVSMERQNRPLSLLMIDVDFFKSINDTRGHLVGDRVICEIANAIESSLACDECVPVRFGGEEFVALLPGYSADQGLALAEQLRKSVEDICFFETETQTAIDQPKCVPQPHFSVSISVGVAVKPPVSAHCRSGMQLLDQADQALYTAKESGRNCCVVYSVSELDNGMSATG